MLISVKCISLQEFLNLQYKMIVWINWSPTRMVGMGMKPEYFFNIKDSGCKLRNDVG